MEREGSTSGWQTGSCYYGRSTQQCTKSLQCSLVQQFQHAQGSPWNQMGLDKAPNPLRILHNFLASSISEFNLWISWHNLWYKACMALTCSAVWARYRTWTYWQKGKIAMSVGMNKNYDVADLGSTGVARIICINHHRGKCRHWCRQIIWRRFFWAERLRSDLFPTPSKFLLTS